MSLSTDQITALNNLGGGWPANVKYTHDLLPTVADSVRDLYVDPVSGSDANDGLTAASPMQKVQKAVLAFKSPFNPPHWAFGQNRTIHVAGASGIVMTESIVIPAHSGLGALIISGQETTAESGLVVGGAPFASIAGYEIRQTLNLTAAGLTPNTYQYNGFVVPQVSLADGVFDASLDSLPILDNAASALTAVALDPGSLSAFSYPAGSLCDIVQPNITWKPEDSSAFSFINTPGVVVLGGPLIIEGFKIAPAAVGGAFGAFIQTVATGAFASIGSTVVGTRNILTGGFSRTAMGEGVSFNGNIIDDSAAFVTFSDTQSLTINNMAARVSFLVFERGSTYIYGLDFEQPTAGLGAVRVRGMAFGRIYADIRSATGTVQLAVLSCGDYQVAALSVENAGANAAVQIGGGFCGLKVAANAGRLNGTAGNTDVGCDLIENTLSEAANEAGITLSGTAGDLRVGALAPRLWTAGAQTDPTELSRYST